MIYNYKNVIYNISKSAHAVTYIKDLAFNLDIKLDIDVDEEGWFFKKQIIRFKVTDENKDKIKAFKNELEETMDNYIN